MVNLLNIAEKAIPMLDALSLELDVIYKVDMIVKRTLDRGYIIYKIENVNMSNDDYSSPTIYRGM